MIPLIKPLILVAITALFIELEKRYGSTDKIHDMGFELLSPLTDILKTHTETASVLALVNTIVVVGCYTYLFVKSVLGRSDLIFPTIMIFSLRLILGLATRLPVPDTYEYDVLDFPHMLTDKTIYFFSGHVAILVLVARLSSYKKTLHTINVMQSIRLIATHGHYTIDILVGVAVGWFASLFVEDVKTEKEKDL